MNPSSNPPKSRGILYAKTILVVEDDKYISHFIDISLSKENYKVIVAETADEGMFLFSSHKPDVLLLDLGLPDKDGLDLLRELRAFSDVPVLVVSARGQEKEKILALDLGANDYITKPFHMGELMARIRAAIRTAGRSEGADSDSKFVLESLEVDYEKHRVAIEGAEVHLTPIEYKTLLLLITNRGKVLTHNYIIRQIWGYDGGDSKSIRVFMASLRRKLEKDTAHPRFILTEVGVGYRFAEEQNVGSSYTFTVQQTDVLEQTGLNVSHLYIAQVKRKCGIIKRENCNKTEVRRINAAAMPAE